MLLESRIHSCMTSSSADPRALLRVGLVRGHLLHEVRVVLQVHVVLLPVARALAQHEHRRHELLGAALGEAPAQLEVHVVLARGRRREHALVPRHDGGGHGGRQGSRVERDRCGRIWVLNDPCSVFPRFVSIYCYLDTGVVTGPKGLRCGLSGPYRAGQGYLEAVVVHEYGEALDALEAPGHDLRGPVAQAVLEDAPVPRALERRPLPAHLRAQWVE